MAVAVGLGALGAALVVAARRAAAATGATCRVVGAISVGAVTLLAIGALMTAGSPSGTRSGDDEQAAGEHDMSAHDDEHGDEHGDDGHGDVAGTGHDGDVTGHGTAASGSGHGHGTTGPGAGDHPRAHGLRRARPQLPLGVGIRRRPPRRSTPATLRRTTPAIRDPTPGPRPRRP